MMQCNRNQVDISVHDCWAAFAHVKKSVFIVYYFNGEFSYLSPAWRQLLSLFQTSLSCSLFFSVFSRFLTRFNKHQCCFKTNYNVHKPLFVKITNDSYNSRWCFPFTNQWHTIPPQITIKACKVEKSLISCRFNCRTN